MMLPYTTSYAKIIVRTGGGGGAQVHTRLGGPPATVAGNDDGLPGSIGDARGIRRVGSGYDQLPAHQLLQANRYPNG